MDHGAFPRHEHRRRGNGSKRVVATRERQPIPHDTRLKEENQHLIG
ncbi:MAG: hypothetical protein Q6373_014175 [Candidatus Sigynarchaeota archaeon]